MLWNGGDGWPNSFLSLLHRGEEAAPVDWAVKHGGYGTPVGAQGGHEGQRLPVPCPSAMAGSGKSEDRVRTMLAGLQPRQTLESEHHDHWNPYPRFMQMRKWPKGLRPRGQPSHPAAAAARSA